jgi:hypothetical protein
MQPGDVLVPLFWAVVGALIGAALTLAIERARRPRLTLRVGTPNIQPANLIPGQPAATWLYVEAVNPGLTPPLSWFYAGTVAPACRASIRFLHLDTGRPVFADAMPGRWADAPPPGIARGVAQGGAEWFALAEVHDRRDIQPGEAASIDTVVRSAPDQACYGYTDASYLPHLARHPDLRLPRGRYLVEVTVTTAGRPIVERFELANEGEYADFRLYPFAGRA